MTNLGQFWKPPADLIPKPRAVVTPIKAKSPPAKPKHKPKPKKPKRPSRGSILRATAKEYCLAHFGLHQHATKFSICHCIVKETGWEVPGTKVAANRMMVKYHKAKNRKPPPQRVYRAAYIPAEKFYSSNGWKELRYIALKNSDGKCNLCGASAHDGVQIHVDHIVPRSKDPSKQLDLDNLQVLCDDCNVGKSNYDDTDWRNKP